MTLMKLYTIGHSAHPIGTFSGLLKLHGIELVADVRTVPASRFHPHFNQRALETSLAAEGIGYAFMGRALGGRPADPACLKDGQPDYEAVMAQGWFTEAIAELIAAARAHRVAILCAEEDPARCHRHRLIAAYLRRQHPEVAVRHIRKDGSLLDKELVPCASPSPERSARPSGAAS